jgi:Sulfatase-modifying factor enzyme 1
MRETMYCGSCAAARGAAIETSPAALPASGIAPSPGPTTSAFGWCCGLPLFRSSALWHLWALELSVLRLIEGVRGRLPPPQKNAFFGIIRPLDYQQPVRRSGKVVRGGSWNNNRDNARCAYRNRNQPDNRNDNIGFRVVLRSAHVLPPLLLVLPQGGAARQYTRAGRVPEMWADPRKWVCPPRRRKKNSARRVWSARRPQGRATPGAPPAPGA